MAKACTKKVKTSIDEFTITEIVFARENCYKVILVSFTAKKKIVLVYMYISLS